MVYIISAVHNEEGGKESITNLIDPVQLNGFLRFGIKREIKSGHSLIVGLQAKIGLSGFPAGRLNPSLPQLWPTQFGLLAGWEISSGKLFSSK